MEFIYFNSRDELIRLPIANIVYFEADGNYTYAVTTNEMRISIGLNLGNMEKALATQLGDSAKTFIRIGKRFIVNRRYIFNINVLRQSLALSDFAHFAFKIPVSKDALRNLKKLLIEQER